MPIGINGSVGLSGERMDQRGAPLKLRFGDLPQLPKSTRNRPRGHDAVPS